MQNIHVVSYKMSLCQTKMKDETVITNHHSIVVKFFCVFHSRKELKLVWKDTSACKLWQNQVLYVNISLSDLNSAVLPF